MLSGLFESVVDDIFQYFFFLEMHKNIFLIHQNNKKIKIKKIKLFQR